MDSDEDLAIQAEDLKEYTKIMGCRIGKYINSVSDKGYSDYI